MRVRLGERPLLWPREGLEVKRSLLLVVVLLSSCSELEEEEVVVVVVAGGKRMRRGDCTVASSRRVELV